MKIPWKKIVRHAAEQAYHDEVVSTLMEDSVIGKDGWFRDKEEWITSRIQEWIDECIGVDEEAKK